MEYILYLNPKRDSEAYRQLSEFWEVGKQCMPENLAFSYPFHVTLVSFFRTSDPNAVAYEAKKLLEKSVFGEFFVSVGNIYTNGTFKMIPISSPQLDEYISKITEKFDFIHSRVIGKLHLTLINNINEEHIPIAEKLLSKIDVTKWTDDWQVVMWCRNGDKWAHMFLE